MPGICPLVANPANARLLNLPLFANSGRSGGVAVALPFVRGRNDRKGFARFVACGSQYSIAKNRGLESLQQTVFALWKLYYLPKPNIAKSIS